MSRTFLVFVSHNDGVAATVDIVNENNDMGVGFEDGGSFTLETGDPLSVDGEHIMILKAKHALSDKDFTWNSQTVFRDKATNAPMAELIENGETADDFDASKADAPAEQGVTTSQAPANELNADEHGEGAEGHVQTGEPLGSLETGATTQDAGNGSSLGVAESNQQAGQEAGTDEATGTDAGTQASDEQADNTALDHPADDKDEEHTDEEEHQG